MGRWMRSFSATLVGTSFRDAIKLVSAKVVDRIWSPTALTLRSFWRELGTGGFEQFFFHSVDTLLQNTRCHADPRRRGQAADICNYQWDSWHP